MKTKYRKCEIEVTREKSMGGWEQIFYSVFTNDGYEITSGFSVGEDSIKSWVADLKRMVDLYLDSPSEFENEYGA